MITFEEAGKIALDKISSDCALITDQIIEKPYGWYFCSQGKKYLETGKFSDMLIGSGGFIVEKENGRVVEFGSAYSREKYFEEYERGFLGKRFDLIVLKVRDLRLAVRLLHKLRMSYVEPEFAYGVWWRVGQSYNEKQLKTLLSKLPVAFENQYFSFMFEIFEEINKSKCLEYELRKREEE